MSSAVSAPVQFPAVKAVLDKIILDWTTGNGAPPNLPGKHGPTFGWDTSADLKNAFAKGYQLIQPNIIGQIGLGHTANLVLALTTGVGGYPPMPLGGLDSNNGTYLSPDSPQIQTIINWIEGGCQG